MLGRLVAWSLRRRLIVLLATMGILAWGVDAYRKLPIDAFPDVSPIQVLVAMQAPGLPPEELEAQVTNPAEVAMKGIPNLVSIRSITRYARGADDLRIRAGDRHLLGAAPRWTSGWTTWRTSCPTA